MKRIELAFSPGRFEDEDEILLENGEFGAIWRKLDGGDLFGESVGAEDDLAEEGNEERVTVLVDADEENAIG